MSEPTFFEQYQFICDMKSSYQIHVPGTKICDLAASIVPRGRIEVLALRQKQVYVPPTFFQLSIDFLASFYLLSNML